MATTNLMPDDRRSLTLRLSVMQYLIAVVFAALAVGFWIFQIAQHQKFLETAENNRLRKLPLPAPRGVLLDRDGKILVENQNTLNIALVREQTKNIADVLRSLAAATGADEAQLRDMVNRRRREPTYRPIVLIENATREQVIAVWARRLELPGIIYQEVPSRKYPGERHGGAPLRLRRRSDRTAAAACRLPGGRARHDRRPGRRRARLQQEADGHGRRQGRSSSTASAARSASCQEAWIRPSADRCS